MSNQDKFWMVLGRGVPTHRHSTEEVARNEAGRLAKLNPDQDFYVLEAIAVARSSTVSWSNLRSPASVHIEDDKPF